MKTLLVEFDARNQGDIRRRCPGAGGGVFGVALRGPAGLLVFGKQHGVVAGLPRQVAPALKAQRAVVGPVGVRVGEYSGHLFALETWEPP